MNKSKVILALLCCLMQCLMAFSQTANADSINKAAQSDDFIHAYIDIASAGKEVYSCFGHSAIRLTCPSKSLDFCFTFEIDTEESGAWDFVRHNAKAGFAAAPANEFLKQYNNDGRGITQYELNLKPHEKQMLWKLLDEETAKGPTSTFDFYKTSCSSMVMWAVECALDSSQLSFTHMPECLNGNYNDALDYMAENSPWYGLVWHIINIDGGPNNSDVTERMAPKMMAECLPYGLITTDKGNVRPLLKGKPQQIFAATYIDSPCWFRPWMAGCLLVIFIVSLILYRKRKIKNK